MGTYIITELCADHLDISCVEACPVDCIYLYDGDDTSIPTDQLLIDPDECIDCGACEPVCPWEAIFPEAELPSIFKTDLALNARIVDEVREIPTRSPDVQEPSPSEVEENKIQHGFPTT